MFKTVLKSVAPKLFRIVHPPWSRFRLRQRDQNLERIRKAVIAEYGLKVIGGPFAGMAYVPEAINSGFVPKLLGCYEDELSDVMSRILENDYSTIVDVGSAEGYYAVGFALRYPNAHVHAFDIDPLGQRLCADMARANGVSERVSVGSECNVDTLRELQGERLLLISDCEGYEIELLQPDLVPGLACADILVELHDCNNPGITPALVARFEATHHISLIDSRKRDGRHYPQTQFLSRADRHLAVDDLRVSAQQWAFMTPKQSHRANDMGGHEPISG